MEETASASCQQAMVKLGDQGFEPADPPSHAGILGRYVTWFSCYMIKVPRFFDEDLRTELQHARSQLDEKARFRDSIRVEIQAEYRKKLFAAKTEEDVAREARKARYAKQQEKESIQPKINLLRIKSSVDWIKERIHQIDRTLNHETIPLKQEKEYIQEMKKLKQQLRELEPIMGPRTELEKIFSQKDQIEEQFKTLNKELQSLKAVVLQAESNTRAARSKCNGDQLSRDLEEKFIKAKSHCEKSYEYIQYLKSQLTERNKPFYQYREDRRIATNHVTAGDKDSLQDLCNQQVEEVMKRWNQDIEFRKNYIKAKERNTLTRLRTLDGRFSLGPKDSNQLDKLEKLTTYGGIVNEEPEKVENGIQQTREKDNLAREVEEWSRKEELSRIQELKRKEETKETRARHDVEDLAKAEHKAQKDTEVTEKKKKNKKKKKKKKKVGSMDCENTHLVDVLPELGDKQAANELNKHLLGQRPKSDEAEEMIMRQNVVKEMSRRQADYEPVEAEYKAQKKLEVVDELKEEAKETSTLHDQYQTKAEHDEHKETEVREKKRGKKKKKNKKKKIGSMDAENAHVVDVLPELGTESEDEEMIRQESIVKEMTKQQADEKHVQAEYEALKEPEIANELKEEHLLVQSTTETDTKDTMSRMDAKAEVEAQYKTDTKAELREKKRKKKKKNKKKKDGSMYSENAHLVDVLSELGDKQAANELNKHQLGQRHKSEEAEEMIRRQDVVEETMRRQADCEPVEAADELKEEAKQTRTLHDEDQAKAQEDEQKETGVRKKKKEKKKNKKKKVGSMDAENAYVVEVPELGDKQAANELNKEKMKRQADEEHVEAEYEAVKEPERGSALNVAAPLEPSKKFETTNIWNLLCEPDESKKKKKKQTTGFEEVNVKIVAPPEPSQQPETTKRWRCLQTWTFFLLAILLLLVAVLVLDWS